MQNRSISKELLLDSARELLDRGGRLSNAVCIDEGETFEVIYIFQVELELKSFWILSAVLLGLNQMQ